MRSIFFGGMEFEDVRFRPDKFGILKGLRLWVVSQGVAGLVEENPLESREAPLFEDMLILEMKYEILESV